MAQPGSSYASYRHFRITCPSEYVALVEINRPEKLNAFIEDMWVEFGRIFNQLSRDADVRAVVLTGAGDRAFTSGLDVQAASQGQTLQPAAADGARKAAQLRRHLFEFQDCISSMEKCEKRMSFVAFALPRRGPSSPSRTVPPALKPKPTM